jgi:activator of HSP90 ATPase
MTTDWPEGYAPSKLELTFKETSEGTDISMVHSNVPAEQEKELAEGWEEFYWNPLKKYFQK